MEVIMLTEDGPKILEAIHYVRSLMEQISLLLQTCDNLLGEQGWECIHGSTAVWESSASLMNPKHWVPKDAFRLYMRADKSWSGIVFVSVLLDDVMEGYRSFSEPVITAACLVNNKATSYDDIRKSGYHYWWSRFYGWDGSDHDGHIIDTDMQDTAETETRDIKHLIKRATFGYPLVMIKDANDLKEKIVDPLIDLAKKMEEGSD